VGSNIKKNRSECFDRTSSGESTYEVTSKTAKKSYRTKKLPPQKQINRDVTTSNSMLPKTQMHRGTRIQAQNQNEGQRKTSTNPFDDDFEQQERSESASYRPPVLEQKNEFDSGDLEEALIRERHSEVLEISRSMRQINEISHGKDLKTLNVI